MSLMHSLNLCKDCALCQVFVQVVYRTSVLLLCCARMSHIRIADSNPSRLRTVQDDVALVQYGGDSGRMQSNVNTTNWHFLVSHLS